MSFSNWTRQVPVWAGVIGFGAQVVTGEAAAASSVGSQPEYINTFNGHIVADRVIPDVANGLSVWGGQEQQTGAASGVLTAAEAQLADPGNSPAKAEARLVLAQASTIRHQRDYDTRGVVERETLPYTDGESQRWINYRYDALDRPILTHRPDGSEIHTRHLAGDGFLAAEVTDELGNKRVSHFDSRGNELHRDRFDGGTRMRTSYGYDTLDRMIRIEDPLGVDFAYDYDGHGNRTVTWDPALGCRQMTYDAANRLSMQLSADGARTTYRYDGLGRVLEKQSDRNALQYPDCYAAAAVLGGALRWVTGDYDGNGTSDLLAVWNRSGANAFFTGVPAGGFSDRGEPIARPAINSSPDVYRAGDFDGDGREDVLVFWKQPGQNRFFFADGAGGFATSLSLIEEAAVNSSPDDVLVADFNGDGRDDLLFFWRREGLNRFFFGQSDRSFSYLGNPIETTAVNSTPDDVLAGDFNGDGRDDLLFFWKQPGTNRFAFGQASGGFVLSTNPIAAEAINGSPDKVVAGDFDGDGRDDLMFFWPHDGLNRLMLGRGDNRFDSLGTRIEMTAVNQNPDDMIGGDFDGDGRDDLLFFWRNTGLNRVFLGRSDRWFDKIGTPIEQTAVNSSPDGILSGDFNGDSRSDLIFVWSSLGLSRLVLGAAGGQLSYSGTAVERPLLSRR